MKTRKLVSMVEFILEIDWLTTMDFCKQYGIPLPKHNGDIDYGVSEMFRIDAVKQKMYVDYAKFLNKKITYDMFEGDNRIFECGKYINRQPSTIFNTYEVKEVVLFADTNTERNVPRGLKISDLTSLGIFYSER